MKVAYILNTPNAANYKVGEMILPQLESGNPKGERLAKVAAENEMLLMMCDQCANTRGLASENPEGGYLPEGTVEGVAVGCFPDLYQALSGNMPDQVISL